MRRNKRAISYLTDERDLLAQIIDGSPDGMVFVNATTGHLIVSRSFSELFGQPIDPEQGTSQKLGILCWPDGTPLTANELPSASVLLGEPMIEKELLIVRRDGRRIPVTERASPVLDHHGTVAGVIISYRDISAHKEVERLRNEFVAMVAHDLRSPLQTILLQLSSMQSAAAEGKMPAHAAFDRLHRTGERLAQMTNDLLDSSRLELSRIRLDMIVVAVVPAVEVIVERMRPALGDHHISLEERSVPPAALLDVTRFDQILTNLIENAAKYSTEGTPIHVWVAGTGGGVEIAVQDQGAGISADEVPQLFDRFYQTKYARSRMSGLGLGLCIAKGFVEAHGGRISVESVPGCGSTFRVWFPAAAPADDVSSPSS